MKECILKLSLNKKISETQEPSLGQRLAEHP